MEEKIKVPPGWKLVPIDPDKRMMPIGQLEDAMADYSTWMRMVNEAPTHPDYQPAELDIGSIARAIEIIWKNRDKVTYEEMRLAQKDPARFVEEFNDVTKWLIPTPTCDDAPLGEAQNKWWRRALGVSYIDQEQFDAMPRDSGPRKPRAGSQFTPEPLKVSHYPYDDE